MIFLLASAAAALIAIPQSQTVRRHHRHAAHAALHPRPPGSLESARRAVSQNRVARMERLALLVRREALLHDFLIKARTETPIFADEATHRLEPGIEINATHVATDFIGSPIIRARVSNRTATRQALLLEAQISSANGDRATAAEALTLEPGETRTVELLCPSRISPASLIWSTTPL